MGLWMVAGASLASTLDTLPGAPGYVHEVFGVDDGLPMAGIVQTLQTRDGFLWLATFDGLVRFDGDRFEVFDSERVPALGSNRIEDLLESRDGTLLIRTEQGHVSRYAGGVFSACEAPRPDGVTCNSREAGAAWYTLLTEDAAGTVWLAGSSGLFRFLDGRLRQVPHSQTGVGARRLLWDRAGRLWVANPKGAWVAEPGRPFRSVVSQPSSLAKDAAGEVWIATVNGTGRVRNGVFEPEIPGWGVVVEDGRGGVLLAVGDRLLRGIAGKGGRGFEAVARNGAGYHSHIQPGRSVCTGPGGEEWIAWRNTLYRNGVPVLGLTSPPGNVASVARDREGTLWVTTSRSGELHALHPARLATFAEGLPDPLIYSVYEDRDGTVLAGGFEHASALAPGARRFRPLPPVPASQQSVLSFLRDRAGDLWVGTTTRGIFLQDRGGFVPAGPEALRTAEVRAIHEDSRGALWVGTNIGLFRRGPRPEGSRWSWIRPEDGLPFPWVRVIKESQDGTLWLGTNGGGVIRLKDGRFTSIDQGRGLSSNLVRSIWVAPDGRLWIGTENRGLNRLDPASIDSPEGPRIAVLGQRQGLYSNGIHQIVADGLGNLWMSSNHGIFRAKLRDLDAVADGAASRVETVAYTERDGMRVREANGSVQDAGFRDRSGRIWFPTQAGVVRIDPRQALRSGPPPRPHVVRLLAGGEEVPVAGGAARLSPAQRSFTVEITAPSFQAPERLKLRYRLTPYDREWIDAGARREAAYTKVPPGSYVFEVAAAAPGGDWSQPAAAPASIRLSVVPRFFETSAFLAACALAAGAALLGGVRLWGARQRVRAQALERLVDERTATIAEQAEKLRELDRLKSQLFANVSHELRTPLTLTLGPLRDILDGRFGPLGEEAAGQIEVALRNAGHLLGLVDQLLDVARLDAGRLRLRVWRGDLAAHVRGRVERFLPLAERRRIDLSLDSPAEPVEIWFDGAQLEKVFDNLLANALKFTPRGGRVRVAMKAPPGDERVEVSVQDDGPGIPADQLERIFERFYQAEGTGRRWPGAGIGLELVRQLVELHGGSVSVASEEGHGACFTVRLLRGRDHLPADLVEVGEPEAIAGTGPLPEIPELPVADTDDVGDTKPDDDRTTVLVVDDNAEIRAYIRRHLEPDYRVVEAADGSEGLERARQLTPDLVVSDVMMPGLDGNALFRSLREDPELELVPVILLTAKASAESRIQGLREGVDDYLVKPFDPRELRARVDNLLASRKRLLERIGTPTPPRPPRVLRVSEVSVTPADESLLARVQALVEERLGDPELSVGALAGALGCDRSYLLRKLRALTGESPSGLIRSLRLQRAEQLLRDGAGPVSEIAYAVGFKSVAHFSNAFHEQYGERPSVFAARHRGR
ncbi:MAG TPA: two-component regulator propeller domain-containing protein [Thermoanaerobaculia bacterium]|nr:two-component regulator propeller domain-containing protein [Thermoanaerobaculia bacterium]